MRPRPTAVVIVLIMMALHSSTAHPLQDSTLGLDEVVFSPEISAVYLGSPSILRLRGSNVVLYTTDRFGSGTFSRNVSVHRRLIDENVGFVNQSDWNLVRVAANRFINRHAGALLLTLTSAGFVCA